MVWVNRIKAKNTEPEIYGINGNAGSGAIVLEVSQSKEAWIKNRALTSNLMEAICSKENLTRSYKKVRANKGSAGIDKMTVDEAGKYLVLNGEKIVSELLNGTYNPLPVKSVEIPKSNGGVRKLGIPAVIDRVIQQAILQVLDPIFDPTFSDSSYGFRPKRGAQKAVESGAEYVKEGRAIVVDIDLEKFFDKVNHDRLMTSIGRRIGDKRLLKVIGKFLRAGIMENGICIERSEGTPQGSPLSPLLSNIVLDELDKELEKRGHKFCRYADDCNVYVKSLASGERTMSSITQFIEKRLKLKVNQNKSTVAKVEERKFLGYTIRSNGGLSVAKESIKRFKDKVRTVSNRSRGRKFESIISELNPIIRGWINYFSKADNKSLATELDGWIRRRLRCYKLKQCKKPSAIARLLISLNTGKDSAMKIAYSSKGWWVIAQTPQTNRAMSNKWFTENKLISMLDIWKKLNVN